jgi:hypothetical protein
VAPTCGRTPGSGRAKTPTALTHVASQPAAVRQLMPDAPLSPLSEVPEDDEEEEEEEEEEDEDDEDGDGEYLEDENGRAKHQARALSQVAEEQQGGSSSHEPGNSPTSRKRAAYALKLGWSDTEYESLLVSCLACGNMVKANGAFGQANVRKLVDEHFNPAKTFNQQEQQKRTTVIQLVCTNDPQLFAGIYLLVQLGSKHPRLLKCDKDNAIVKAILTTRCDNVKKKYRKVDRATLKGKGTAVN